MSELNAAALAQLAEVQGQLKVMTQLLINNHASTNQRIDDMRKSMETRMDGFDDRLGQLEQNERGTAMRTASISAVSAAVVAAGIRLLTNGN